VGDIDLFDFFVLRVHLGKGLKRTRRPRGRAARRESATAADLHSGIGEGGEEARALPARYIPAFQQGGVLSRGLGLLARLGLGPSRFARGFGGFLQAVAVSEAAAAFLDFIVLFTHGVSPSL
jgi:hypothetical protein